MLHLFNKVYLEFDEKIDINYDRVVISDQYGKPMLSELDKISYGELILYGASYENVILANMDLVRLVEKIKTHSDSTGKKVFIYCDTKAYKTFLTQWLKTILPNLNISSFKKILDLLVYNQRAVSNTQLSSNYSVKLQNIWNKNGLGDAAEYWEKETNLNSGRLENLKALNLNLSYEFLISDYLSGSLNYKQKLKTTLHMFLRRWFKELFTDNRQMVLLNLTNHKFLSSMEIDPDLIDVTRLDPLAGIDCLQYYADDSIWEMSSEIDKGIFGICKIEGISDETAHGLTETLFSVYSKVEGMQINDSPFETLENWLKIAAKESMSDAELDSIIDYVVAKPFDTSLVPRFDFQNVNFPLLQYFFSKKFNKEDLSTYRLL